MRIIKNFIILLSFVCSTFCFAGNPQQLNNKDVIHQKILTVVEQYATSLGCIFHINPNNIVSYKLNRDIVFVALYSLDLGCSGGSNMSRPAFVVIRAGAYNTYLVDPRYSSPLQTSSNLPQHLNEIFIKNDEIWYKALKHDFSKDPICCPSIQIEGRIKYKNGLWVDESIND